MKIVDPGLPTEVLAPLLKDMVVKILQDIPAEGVSILLVEHAMDVALRLASRAYVMSKGTIVFQETSEHLSANKEVRQKYLEV